jgi:uncharacterized protein YggE
MFPLSKYWRIAGLLSAIGVLAIALVVAGCTGDDAPTTIEVGNTSQPIDTITVSGQGEVKAGPDEAVLTVSVETEAPEAAQALEENSKQMEQVLERLRSEGLDEDSLQTANVAVYPNHQWDPQTNRETIEGYRAQNSIRVTVTDLTKVGDVFSAAAEAGANNISGPEWRLADDSDAVAEALDKAYASARAKAETLASAAGMKVGSVLSMQESSVAPPVIYETRASGMATEDTLAMAAAPINPMDLDVLGTVTITFRMTE